MSKLFLLLCVAFACLAEDQGYQWLTTQSPSTDSCGVDFYKQDKRVWRNQTGTNAAYILRDSSNNVRLSVSQGGLLNTGNITTGTGDIVTDSIGARTIKATASAVVGSVTLFDTSAGEGCIKVSYGGQTTVALVGDGQSSFIGSVSAGGLSTTGNISVTGNAKVSGVSYTDTGMGAVGTNATVNKEIVFPSQGTYLLCCRLGAANPNNLDQFATLIVHVATDNCNVGWTVIATSTWQTGYGAIVFATQDAGGQFTYNPNSNRKLEIAFTTNNGCSGNYYYSYSRIL